MNRRRQTTKWLSRPAAALLLLLPFASTVARADTADELFDDTHIHDIWLTLDPADWNALKENYLLNTYYPAQFAFNSHYAEKIGIRSRGSGSRSPIKPNLLLSFDKYQKKQTILGLSGVTLKANNQDASMLREVLSMKMLRLMGVPAPREAAARLFINGEFFGAYTLVEKIDSTFLTGAFSENDGFLYEWEAMRTDQGYRFEYLGPEPENYSPVMWSPSNHEDDPNPAPIVEMVDFVNNSSYSDFEERLPEYLDVEEFINYIATENFVADFDGILGTVFGMNNFYVYRFENSNRSTFIAWDKDSSFDWENKPIFEGVYENVLARRMMEVPRWRNMYLAALLRAANLAGGPDGMLAKELERLYNLIHESAWADVNKQCSVEAVMVSCSGGDFEAGVEHLRAFLRSRADFVTSEVQAAGFQATAVCGSAKSGASLTPCEPGSQPSQARRGKQ